MLNSLKSSLIKTLLIPMSVAAFAIPHLCAAAEFKLDPGHSYVLWTVDHFGFGKVNGKVFAEGTLHFDEKNHKLSSVDATLDLGTMTTGIKQLDSELHSKDYFDAAQFPKASFKSNKVEMKGKNMALVQGMLTLHGVSKPITLNVTFRKHDMHPLRKADAVGFSATGTLNRSDYGLKAYIPAVSDKVDLDLVVEAVAEKSTQ